jgi:hypothetical protein
MVQPPGLKAALKRGALLAAANWPLVAVQFIAESTLKLLLAVPVVGGVILVVLLLDAEAGELLTGDLILAVEAVLAALGENPVAVAAFVLSFLIVLVGGSALTFVVKSGTMALLAEADATAGPIEHPPLKLKTLKRANRTAIEPFLAACQHFWRRYVRLGLCLLLVYAITATAAAYLAVLLRASTLSGNIGVLLGWTVAAFAATSVLVVWIILVNLFYLLTQMIMTVEDIGVRMALRGVFRFVRASLRELAGIFGVILLLVVLGFVGSFLGATGLGLISWVPVVALAVMPLQVAAWLLRGFVFQYLALTAVGAYLTQYRHYKGGSQLAAVPGQRLA